MKRLFVVSYCFPPILTAEAILIAQTLQGLDAHGWPSTVLTVSESTAVGWRDPSLRALLPGSVEVVTAPTFERPLRSFRRAPLRSLLHLGLPEEQFMWYATAASAARKLVRGGRFSAVLSWSSFPTSNVVGYAAKTASGLPWIAHFSDPWIDGPYAPRRPLQRLTCARLERGIIRHADAVTFTTERTAHLVMRKYPPAWRSKAHVVPHGYVPFEDGSETPPGRLPLELVHAGTFYKGKRTPLALFEAMSRLNAAGRLRGKMHLVLVGPIFTEYVRRADSLGLLGLVEFIGPRSYADTRRIVARAHVPVVIEAPSKGPSVFLPSKLVDALALRRPILAVTPLEGSSADLIRRLGLPLAPPDDVSAIAAALESLVERHERGELRVDPHFEAVAAEYRIERTSGQLAKLLVEVADGRAASS